MEQVAVTDGYKCAMRRGARQPAWLSFLVSSVVLLTSVAGTAQAQSPLQVVEQLNAEAMEAFTNLDIERAGSMLEEALRVAHEGNVSGRPLALANLNLGIVYVAGLNEVEAGTKYFVDALCADSGVELDPLHSSPEIQEAFAAAQAQAAEANCAAAAASPAAPAVSVQPIVHVAPTEQQTQTPLPLFAQIATGIGVARVSLVYKSLGMDAYKRVPMVTYQDGVAYQISCNDVFEPKVSYYFEALNSQGNVVASLGSEAEPFEVPVMTGEVTMPPSLPSAQPPASCVARECPPGLQCDRPGTAAIGEACEETSECQSGLACVDDACAIPGAGDADLSEAFAAADDDETPWSDGDGDEGVSTEFNRFYINANLVLGLPWISSGMPADRLPPNSAVFVDSTGQRVLNPQPGQQVYLADDQVVFPDAVTEWVPDADSGDSMSPEIKGPCPADGVVTGPNTGQLYPSSYCVRVRSAGFSPQGAVRFAAGYFVTDDIAVAAVTRIQFNSGVSTLNNILLGVRGEYALSKPTNDGFFPTVFAGLTVGQIQAQPNFSQDNPNAPWIKSGLMGFHVGANFRMRLHENFGLIAGPELDMQFPDFLFNIDIPIGVEAAF